MTMYDIKFGEQVRRTFEHKKSRIITPSAYSCEFLTSCLSLCSRWWIIWIITVRLTSFAVQINCLLCTRVFLSCDIQITVETNRRNKNHWRDNTKQFSSLRENNRNFSMKWFKFFLETTLLDVNGLKSILIHQNDALNVFYVNTSGNKSNRLKQQLLSHWNKIELNERNCDAFSFNLRYIVRMGIPCPFVTDVWF